MHSRSGFKFRVSGLVSLGLAAAFFVLPRSSRAAPLFTEDTFKSLGVGSAQTACADSGDPGCYTNWLELADLDGDTDFDIVMANGGGVFGPGNLEAAVVYLNDGKGAFLNATNSSFSGAPSQVRQVAVGDIDGDGDLDIYQPGAYGTDLDKLWVQTAPRVFADQAQTLLPASTASHAASTHFGDLDGDGDLDLVVADWGDASASSASRLILYSNDGHGQFTLTETQKDEPDATDHFPAVIAATSAAPYYGARPTDLDFADVDGDFDLDILINHREGYSRIFLNDGHGYFRDGTGFSGTAPTDITANYAPKRGPYANNQEACDVDHDGDLDLILDNAGKAPDGTSAGLNVTQLLINDGHGVFVDQTGTRILGEPAAQDGAAKCADVNGDGHYDIVVGSRTHSSEKVLLNDGSGVFTYAADALPNFSDLTLAVDVGDLNGDGKLDLVTGQGEGTITSANAATLRNNRVYYGLAADITPPTFRAVETPLPIVGAAIVFHVAVADSATNQAGQMALVSVPYTVKGQTKQAKVSFVGGDLFRVVIPAQPDGTEVSYEPTAVDRAKLTTKLSKVLYVGTPPVTGAGGEGGAADVAQGGQGGATYAASGSGGTDTDEGGAPAMPSGGASVGGMSSAGTGAAGSAHEGGDAGSSDGPGPTPSGSDDGCSCSMLPSSDSGGIFGLGLGLALLGFARRRRPR
ncbi:MAG TPA: VCBS repeat-containing protein [Polyangiaceae bacterium]|nr:VCBS repeat-containing protein [Polyangiaceae bacterium]